jgi:predicted CXXCH cytochrome family protein
MAFTNKFIIHRKDQRIEDVVIESDGLTIGRLQGNDLALNNRAVAPTHAGIKDVSGEFWLFNLSNSHSTVLNGTLIEQSPIADGDVAEIRPYTLRFEKSKDGLHITVEIEADATVGEEKAGTGKLIAPSLPSPDVDEHALKVYWEKRKREAGKVVERGRLTPRGERKMGKAQFNWIPTLDLKQPWRRSYFTVCGVVVAACSLVALIGYSQAFSPGPVAAAHDGGRPQSTAIALRSNGGACYKCHGVTASKDDKCADCHQTRQFAPTISEAHRREGVGCVNCHSEHRGASAASALINPELCANCHNDRYKIKTGERAGTILGNPHGGAFGYPKENGVWKWKGLGAGEWKSKGLPAALASRPVNEQFHAVHRTIYMQGDSQRRMACRDCHTNGVPSAGAPDPSPRNSCASCHTNSPPTNGNTVAANCVTCHQQHGQSKDLAALVTSAAGDYQRLKSLADERTRKVRPLPGSTAQPFGRDSAPAEPHYSSHLKGALLNVGGVPWYGWLGLIAALPALGFAFLAAYAARTRPPVERLQPDESEGEVEEGLARDADWAPLETEELIYPHPVINPLLCIGCHACVEACPHDVLDIVGGVSMPVALDQCMEDTSCMVECPTSPKACVVINTKKVIPPRKVPKRDQSLMTNVPGIYLVGDVSGVPLIKNAINEGARVVEHILEELEREKAGGAVLPENGYDVAIIGIGPAGLSATSIAKQRGLKYVAIEQNKIVNTISNYPAGKYVFFKPDTVEAQGGIPLPGVGGIKEETIRRWMEVVNRNGIEIHEEESCKKIEPNENGFSVITEKDGGRERMNYQARKVILAIGNHGSPMKLQVTGEDLKIPARSNHEGSGSEFLDDKVKFKLSDPDDYVNRKLIVVGAGNSAIEAAVALTGFTREGDTFKFTRDNEVTLVVRSDFKGDLKLGNKIDVYDCIEAGKIKAYFRTAIKEIRPDEVTLMDARTKEEKGRIPNDYIFALIGSEKPTKFLEGLGIKIG